VRACPPSVNVPKKVCFKKKQKQKPASKRKKIYSQTQPRVLSEVIKRCFLFILSLVLFLLLCLLTALPLLYFFVIMASYCSPFTFCTTTSNVTESAWNDEVALQQSHRYYIEDGDSGNRHNDKDLIVIERMIE
jgi:hypothetical protein